MQNISIINKIELYNTEIVEFIPINSWSFAVIF